METNGNGENGDDSEQTEFNTEELERYSENQDIPFDEIQEDPEIVARLHKLYAELNGENTRDYPDSSSESENDAEENIEEVISLSENIPEDENDYAQNSEENLESEERSVNQNNQLSNEESLELENDPEIHKEEELIMEIESENIEESNRVLEESAVGDDLENDVEDENNSELVEIVDNSEETERDNEGEEMTDGKLFDIPLNRVKKIIKLDDDVSIVSKEAVAAITFSTEFFVQMLAKISAAKTGKKTINLDSVKTALISKSSFRFLEGTLPSHGI